MEIVKWRIQRDMSDLLYKVDLVMEDGSELEKVISSPVSWQDAEAKLLKRFPYLTKSINTP